MNASVKLAAILATNLAVWSGAWIAFTKPAGVSVVAGTRDAGKAAGALSQQPELGEVLDFSGLSPVHAYSRPLFDPSRQAWQPPPPPEPDQEPLVEEIAEPELPPAPPPSVRLVGVSSSGSADMRALVQMDLDPEPVWVLVGDDLGGWKVGSIDPQSITMQRGQEQFSVALYPGGGGSQ